MGETVGGIEAARWRGKRVFLTGHTGFKGGWLAYWLHLLGAEVHGYALAPATDPDLYSVLGLEELCTRSTLADLADAEALAAAVRAADPHVVMHLAAQPLVRYGYQHPLETFRTNVLGTAHLLEACRGRERLEAVLVVTTDKCYRDPGAEGGCKEDDALGGYDPYAASKASAELVTASYRHACFPDDGPTRVVSGRAGNVIGGGDWALDRLVPDIARAFSQGQAAPLRSPGAVRPWQHVIAPLRGYLRLVEACLDGGAPASPAYNFGPGPSGEVPVQVLAERMAATWGEGAAVEVVGNAGGPAEAAVLRLDARKAADELGWLPTPGFEQAVDATAEWYQAFYAGADQEALRKLTAAQIEAAAPPRTGA